jgi:hypothetical protein
MVTLGFNNPGLTAIFDRGFARRGQDQRWRLLNQHTITEMQNGITNDKHQSLS